MPDGAMYMMVGLDRKAFPAFENCLQIVEGMVREQSVFCLPGKCFGINDFFRVVLTGWLNEYKNWYTINIGYSNLF